MTTSDCAMPQTLVLQAYMYRIYPNVAQQQLILRMFGGCRFVFNHFLAKWNNAYAETGKSLSYPTCATQLPTLKTEHAWLKEVDSIALQSAVRQVADSFARLFKRQNQAPRFKSRKHPIQSYTTKYTNGNIAVEGSRLKLPKLGWMRFANPGFFREQEKKLALWQRRMSRRTCGGSNWQRAKQKVACIHEQIANTRRDFLQKLTTKLIRENQTISIEDLRVANMLQNPRLSKSIADASWGEWARQLAYKASWYGRNLRVAGTSVCKNPPLQALSGGG